MPSVSGAQHRAMEAAAHGRSALGIPKAVGAEFVRADDAKLAAAGIMFVEPNGRMLLLKRNAGDHPGEWCFPGGGIEDGETPEQAAKREAVEEIGGLPIGSRTLFDRATNADGVDFVTFKQAVPAEFEPHLNDEHSEHVWAAPEALPEPLHPGVARLMGAIGKGPLASDTMAFDKATLRTEDKDGHLFVEITPISKANVCPYYGREIPDFEMLGLDPDRIYKLLRDPKELAKAADSFRGKPLLLIHKPVNADDHPREITVGSVGTEVEFHAPFLMAPLSVWDGEGIALIKSGEQKELSSSYHYRADMTPGEYEGEAYDGVMRDISGNHVALVKEGRAGPDVVVSDSIEELMMSKKTTALTRKAALAQGAVIAYLVPKLAADAKLDLTPLFAGVTAANFKDKKAGIVTGLKTATKGKLAKDASIDDVAKVIDMLEEVKPVEDDAAEIKANDPKGRMMDYLKSTGKLSDDEMKACDEMWGEQEAMDADQDKEKDKEKDKEPEKAEDEEPPVTKKAMDAAIGVATKATEKRMRENFNAVRAAEDAVRPYVGKLAIACDSAEQIYRTALSGLGVAEDEIKDVPLTGLKVILKQIPVPGSKTKIAIDGALATDGASVASFHEMFPEAKGHRVGTV